MSTTRTTTLPRLAGRHGWTLCAGALVGLACGAAAAMLTEPVFASSTSVLVNPVDGSEINPRTEAQLARSIAAETQTAAKAQTAGGDGLGGDGLGGDGPGGLGQVTATRVTVEPLAGTSVLIIRYEAATPEAARAGARASAEAYLANRERAARSAIDDQAKVLTVTVDVLRTERAAVGERIGAGRLTSSELANLRGTASTVEAQITSLTVRVNELTATPIDPGQILHQAELPTRPVRPASWLYLAGGAGAGAVAALAGALGRDRLSRHVGHGPDVARRVGVRALADLPADAANASIRTPRDAGGRAFSRLRNEVVAALAPDERIILVTGTDHGAASTIVAANLAVALARAGNEVVLVGANVDDVGVCANDEDLGVGANDEDLGVGAVTLSTLFDLADIPGLTDVLTGRASLSRALQRAPRVPRLQVITPGNATSAGGLLQCESARAALRTLRGQHRFVVVEAPPATSGPDAQSLAAVADATILVAETGRSRYAHLADAAEQLRLMDARLLGAVVLPRLPAGSPDERQPRAAHRAEDPDRNPADVWFAPNGHDRSAPPALSTPTVALPQILVGGAPARDRADGGSG